MPTVQFRDQVEGVNITATMPTPKKITKMDAWFRAARKVIPQIPDPKEGLWRIEQEAANVNFIRFDLRSREGARVYLIIAR